MHPAGCKCHVVCLHTNKHSLPDLNCQEARACVLQLAAEGEGGGLTHGQCMRRMATDGQAGQPGECKHESYPLPPTYHSSLPLCIPTHRTCRRYGTYVSGLTLKNLGPILVPACGTSHPSGISGALRGSSPSSSQPGLAAVCAPAQPSQPPACSTGRSSHGLCALSGSLPSSLHHMTVM